MATVTPELQPTEEYKDKGLKSGALGLVASVTMGVASTAPAYSLAATLAFVVVLVGFHAPIVAVLAFVPIFLTSIGYSELNKADPDCGTTFTWATRAFGPKTGFAGGWGIVAADVLVMASLAQVAGQYVFLLFGAKGIGGILLLVFIYWGWDTAVSINEETKDKNKPPGRAAILSTLLLLITYAIVIVAVVAFAGTGTKGIGLQNPSNTSDVLSVLGGAIFGGGGFGTFLTRLLILMVLSSAAASTQTTILPTARTTLSMAAYKALPDSFSKIHPKYLTPTVSTIVMGAISIALYVPMNYISGGNVIPDAVTAIGLYIAFYYGLTAFTCVWYYRASLTSSARNLWMQGILPLLGGLLMYAFGCYS